MPKSIWTALLIALLCAPVRAEDASRQEIRSLDEQVQEIKSDVLAISAELNLLEEKLLYPSNTQVAVFVELADGEDFRLDAVQVSIDGRLVAHYIYSFKELEALQNGGVQRIYTGNVPTGEHQIAVAVSGKRSGGDDFSRSQAFPFTKGVEPELLGITLAASGDPGIQLGSW